MLLMVWIIFVSIPVIVALLHMGGQKGAEKFEKQAIVFQIECFV